VRLLVAVSLENLRTEMVGAVFVALADEACAIRVPSAKTPITPCSPRVYP